MSQSHQIKVTKSHRESVKGKKEQRNHESDHALQPLVKQHRHPYSDLGEVDQVLGLIKIKDNFTRKLYPWETVAGFKWLKSRYASKTY